LFVLTDATDPHRNLRSLFFCAICKRKICQFKLKISKQKSVRKDQGLV
jgi:hypothetical protein